MRKSLEMYSEHLLEMSQGILKAIQGFLFYRIRKIGSGRTSLFIFFHPLAHSVTRICENNYRVPHHMVRHEKIQCWVLVDR